MHNKNLDKEVINGLRSLSIDMIDNAKSGHPGIALGAAPIIYTLYSRFIKYNINEPLADNRDRFVLSAGHGSALLYSLLYYLGLLNIDDLKNFRKINSKTPGHPEITTLGVEASTGPLGEGIGMAVGMAIASKHKMEKDAYKVYVLAGDGDFEEGASFESLSIAGNLKLDNLIILYDSNDITLDGPLKESSNLDKKKYFESLGFSYFLVNDGENVEEIEESINKALDSNLPSLIEVKTIIGRFSENEGTNKVHGSVLKEEDYLKVKEKLGNLNKFEVNKESITYFRHLINSRSTSIKSLNIENKDYNYDYSQIELKDEATRDSSFKVLNVIAKENKLLIGGSADTRSSTKSYIDKEDYLTASNYNNRNIAYGIREHGMGSISNGLALSGLIPFASTFLAFSDFLKPSIRLSSLMNLFVIYIFSHDSILLGEDGPTHQAVEQLISLRSIPNLDVYRPADIKEVIGVYDLIMKRKKPSVIVTSRSKVNLKENTNPYLIKFGAYILYKEEHKLDAIIISSGEDIDRSLEITESLNKKGFGIRLISMASINIFEEQSKTYKETIIPKNITTFVIESSSIYSWYKYLKDENHFFGVNTFGLSGSREELLEHFNLTRDKIEYKIEDILRKEDYEKN